MTDGEFAYSGFLFAAHLVGGIMVAVAYGLAVGLAGQDRGLLWGNVSGKTLLYYTGSALVAMGAFLYLVHYWYKELPEGATTLGGHQITAKQEEDPRAPPRAGEWLVAAFVITFFASSAAWPFLGYDLRARPNWNDPTFGNILQLTTPLAIAALSAILILASIVTLKPAKGQKRTPRQTRYWGGAIVAGILLVLHTSILDAYLFPKRWFAAEPLMEQSKAGDENGSARKSIEMAEMSRTSKMTAARPDRRVLPLQRTVLPLAQVP
jgi:hypothetical protein